LDSHDSLTDWRDVVAPLSFADGVGFPLEAVMVTDRIRKKKIRAHMAATGDTYLRAARAIDGADSSYGRNQWMDSAWPRLLPLAEAMHLEFLSVPPP
jgi:hypothetical protein